MRKSNIVVLLTLFAAALHADNHDRGFNATLGNCEELIGFGPVSFAAARSQVPASYTLVPFNGAAGLVVRASRCQSVRVGNSPERPAIVAQIGIAVISPDGSGDINNYTLLYSTDHQQLAGALNDAGLPAVFDRALAYEFTADASGQGEVYVAVSPIAQPAWFLTGSAGPPPSGGGPVVANWWFNAKHGVLKMATSIPLIRYGNAAFSLHTSRLGLLGNLIGGNTGPAFVFFNARGVFDSGVLASTVQ